MTEPPSRSRPGTALHVEPFRAGMQPQLEAGDWILCGAYTQPQVLAPGQRLEAEFGDRLGRLSISVAAAAAAAAAVAAAAAASGEGEGEGDPGSWLAGPA